MAACVRGWRARGSSARALRGGRAAGFLSAAGSGGGLVVLLVDPGGGGVTLEKQIATTGEPLQQITLENVRVPVVDRLGEGGQGEAIVRFVVEHTLAALAAMEL